MKDYKTDKGLKNSWDNVQKMVRRGEVVDRRNHQSSQSPYMVLKYAV